MSTEKQIEANRLNAKKSTGPKSEEGKARVSLNAFRHGLTGRVTLMSEDDRKAYIAHMDVYMKRLNPEDQVERDLAESVADGMWRLKGAAAIEQNLFTNSYTEFSNALAVHSDSHAAEITVALSDAKTFSDETKKFQLLTVYEQRIRRGVDKDLATLRQFQAERKAAHDKALEEEELLAQLSYAEGEPYRPETYAAAPNGFVFSAAQINASIARKRRLKTANQARMQRWDLSKIDKRPELALVA